jgi:uncharacterized protein (AIM24 family)
MASRGRAESTGVDEEFLNNLYRGGELLAAGKVIEAKDYLERAFKLQPKNEKGQNLLGLTYFKLGLFDRAAEIYEILVKDNPVDPTLRVNLGLVYLKTHALPRAVHEFETAVDLAPDHKKAHNYLGLALAQLGNYAEAREHFIEAGSDAMAQKMERALSGESTGLHRMPAPLEQQQDQRFAEIEGSEVVAEQGGQQVLDERRRREAEAESARSAQAQAESQAHVYPAEELPPEVEVQVEESTDGAGDWGAQVPGQHAAPAEEEIRFAEDEGPPALGTQDEQILEAEREGPSHRESFAVMTPEELGAQPAEEEPPPALHVEPEEAASEPMPAALPEQGEVAPGVEQWQAAPLGETRTAEAVGIPLGDLAPTLELLKGPPLPPFELKPEGVAITVAGELLTRVDGLLYTVGQVRFHPELKRFRGRSTDQPFGFERARMMRASGRAVLVVAPGKDVRFQAVDLADESAYFREEAVFAFEEAVMFENGRVPSEATGDLDLVHLRGKGKVLLHLDGVLRSQRVRMDEPVTVPLNRLVGWYGNLSPRLVTQAAEETGVVVHAGAELSGEGFVLVSAPAR